MAVQIQPSKPKEQHDGLQALEADILRARPGEVVKAVVTYARVKRVEDELAGDTYPVMKIRHIEPITEGKDLELLGEVEGRAYQVRTGENELDLDFDGDDDEKGGDA